MIRLCHQVFLLCSYCFSECCTYLTYSNRYTHSMISLLTSVVKSGAVAMEFTTLDCPTYAIAVQVHLKIFFFSHFLFLPTFFLSRSLFYLFVSIFLSILLSFYLSSFIYLCLSIFVSFYLYLIIYFVSFLPLPVTHYLFIFHMYFSL
jgi:hypothetical protein